MRHSHCRYFLQNETDSNSNFVPRHGPYDRMNRVIMGSTAEPFDSVVTFKQRYFSQVRSWYPLAVQIQSHTGPAEQLALAWPEMDLQRCRSILGARTITSASYTDIQCPSFSLIPCVRVLIGLKCVAKHATSKRILSHLATFYPANGLSAREGTSPMPSLVIGQDGIDLVDHILMSILVLQRNEYALPVVES